MLFLTSLSDSETKAWLVASEILLIVATTVLVFGLIGEWSDSETWKNRIWYKVAKAAVIVGVIGELFGDAGIFETSARLDSIRELDNLKLQERAAKAELAIVKMKSPRKLTDVQQHDLIILLKRHTGKK